MNWSFITVCSTLSMYDQAVGEEPKENGGQQKKYISNKITEELLQRNQIILFGLKEIEFMNYK